MAKPQKEFYGYITENSTKGNCKIRKRNKGY